MKKFAAILAIAALPMLGGCVVYGPGPADNAAWANYDFTYDYGHKGYDRPVVYGNYAGYGAGYGAGYDISAGYYGGHGSIEAGVGFGGGYDSYYGYGY